MVGHDDSGVRTGRIADIKDGAGKFPGQVLPWQAQGGKRKQEAQGRNSRKQLRSSRQSSAVQVRIQHGNKSPFHIRWAGNLLDRKSTRLNSSHGYISYAVFCLKKKKYRRSQIYVAEVVQ